MQDKKDFNFDFNFDDEFGESKYLPKKKSDGEYKDIVSSSRSEDIANKISSNDYYANKNYRKKKHGLAKVFSDRYYKIVKWWKCMKKGKKRLIITIASLLLILAILVSLFFILFDYNYKDISADPDDLGFESIISDNVINVALFGIDSRDTNGESSFKGNSDSIMILSINTETKKVKIISIMRDTLVPIERNGSVTYNKINAAYSMGGPELAIKTINQNFGLDISEYATVNFYGMSDIIDAVGGIDAELTKEEAGASGDGNHGINDMIAEICMYKGLDAKDYYITTSGKQHLNGVQAVSYARIRYCRNIWGTNNDYGRTDRQRYVMEQLFNSAKTLKKSEYPKLAKSLIPCSETSLSYSQILGIAFKVMFSNPKFEQYRIPQNDSGMNFLMTSPSGRFGSVVYYDLAYAAKVIKAIIYDDMTIEQYVEQNGIEKNDWYAQRNGSSGSYSSKPSTSSSPQSETKPSAKPNTPPASSEPTQSEVTPPSEEPTQPEEKEPTQPEEPGGESGQTETAEE